MGMGKHPVFRREPDEGGGTHSGALSGFRKPSAICPGLCPTQVSPPPPDLVTAPVRAERHI